MFRIDGVTAIVLCSFLWSTGGVFIKFIQASSLAIAGIRSSIALVIFMIVLKKLPVFCIKTTEGTTDRKKTLYLWLAGFFYAATMILYCVANKLTTAANTILLQYTNPLYIIIFSPVILKEKNSKYDYLTFAGVMIGVVMFFADGVDGGKLLGNILAALSGVTFGFCTIFMRAQKTEGSANSFMLAHLMTSLFGLPFVFIGNGTPADAMSWIFVCLMGIFQMAFATLCYSRGIGKVSALSAGIITMIEPLMNPVWVMIFAHEIPGPMCMAGGAIILSCILIQEIFTARKKKA